MSRNPIPQRTGVNALPDDELARVLAFLRPSLHYLLVCKRWCRVAVDACPALWRSVHVLGRSYGQAEGSDAQLDDQPSGREAVLAGFENVAPHFHQLHFISTIDVSLPQVPELLSLAANHSPHLESLTVAGPLADKAACKIALEAVGAMTELKSLNLTPGRYPTGLVPTSYLAPLSALTQLHSLDLQLFMCCGPLPATILPRLQHLTHLGLRLSSSPFGPEGVFAWGAGAAGSPRLRSLLLYGARLPPQEATVESLCQLESLCLYGLCPTPRKLSTLVRGLTAITHLRLGDAYPADSAMENRQHAMNPVDVGWSMQLLSGCTQLVQLELQDHAYLVALQLPRGALRQLTYLSLDIADVEEEVEVHASWASLPSLARLRVTALPNATLAGLRELDMGATVYEWGYQMEELHFPDLAHLVVSDISFERGLPPHDMLQQLRRLTVQHYSPEWRRGPNIKELPSALAQATSLEVLDLRGCYNLQLRKADAELLNQLTSLRVLEVAYPQEPEVVAYLCAQVPHVRLVEEGL